MKRSKCSEGEAQSRVAVIGAGLSGLVAARDLAAEGYRVTVVEKARGPGGRMARRRQGGFQFDHGAQYFTARSDDFKREVDRWVARGVVAPWSLRLAVLREGGCELRPSRETRYVGVPGMSSLCRDLSSGLEVRYSTRVQEVAARAGGWHLRLADASATLTAHTLVVSTPAPQAMPFLDEAPELARRVGEVAMEPCWAVLCAFPGRIDTAFEGAFVHDSPLSWIARNASKPGRPEAETWVLHGSQEWSARHLEDKPSVVAKRLLDAFFTAIEQPRQTPDLLVAHRWRYSMAREPLTDRCLWSAERRLGVCGDWCAGSRVEGAFESGRRLAFIIAGGATPAVGT